MSETGIRWVKRAALVTVVVVSALVAMAAIAWGSTALYIAAPYFLGGLLLVLIRLWANRMGASLSPRQDYWRQYWDREKRRK